MQEGNAKGRWIVEMCVEGKGERERVRIDWRGRSGKKWRQRKLKGQRQTDR